LPETITAPEQRTIEVDVESLDTRGRTVHGHAAVYGATSEDLGGFRERIAPGAFAGVLADPALDVRALLNHDPNEVLGRTRSGTLRLFDESRGLRFELDLPESPLGQNVRAAVSRHDIDGASFRFVVGEEDWAEDVRTVKTVAALRDVTIATYPAYPAAALELRSRPENPKPAEREETPMQTEDRTEGGLAVEDRAQAAEPTLETRVTDALRAVRRGESRSLTTAAAIAPAEVGTFLFDKLRAASVALASGIRVISTERDSVAWPALSADVAPGWVAETDVIPAGDPAFATLTATPRKLAHRVELSNEVIDDSEPSVVDVLNGHLATMLGLKLDLAIFEGSGTAPAIRGLKAVSGIQTVSMGTNGAALTNLDPFVDAIGLLQAANVPGPYVVALNPRTWTALAKLKEAPTGSNAPLLTESPGESAPPRVVGMPVYSTSQLSVAETQGSASNASSAYVYAPAEVVLVRRKDAEIELDRSRLFDRDMSEMRAKLRADMLVPNPSAVVRIAGVTP